MTARGAAGPLAAGSALGGCRAYGVVIVGRDARVGRLTDREREAYLDAQASLVSSFDGHCALVCAGDCVDDREA